MKGHRLAADNHDHFVIAHPDGTSFKVAKNGLSAPMVGVIAKLPRVEHDDDGAIVGNSGVIGPGDTGIGALFDKITAPGAGNPFPNPVVGLPGQTGPAAVAGAGNVPFDMTTNSAPGDDDAAAQPLPGAPAALGSQTFPTPTGAAPPGQGPAIGGQTAAGAADPGDQYLRDLMAASGAAKGANDTKAGAEGDISDATVTAAEEYQKSIKAANDAYNTKLGDLDTKNNALYEQVANTKIDPNHMWNSASTGSKIGMMAGLLISGAGAGAGQGNMQMNMINKAIDQDIEAQKSNLASKENLLHYNLQRTRDLTSAQAETRLNLLATFKGQIDAAAAKQGSTIAKANAASLNSQIDMQMAGLKHQVAVQHAQWSMLNSSSNGQASDSTNENDVDQESLRKKMLMGQLGYPGGIPKEHTAEVMEEAGKFENLQKNHDTLKQAFDTMSQNAPLISLPGPLKTDAQRKYDAAKGIVREIATRELGGRVTEFSAENVDKTLSAWGDNPSVLKDKFNDISDALKSKAVEDAKGFGQLRGYGVISKDNPYITPSATMLKANRGRK